MLQIINLQQYPAMYLYCKRPVLEQQMCGLRLHAV
jgi:hypothetical protein